MAGYTKLFSSIVTSTVWGLDSDARVVWVTMLAMADQRGVVEGSVPGLARVAVVSIEAVERALAAFLAPDAHSRTPDHEGRRIEAVPGGWRLLNHGAYRERYSADERRRKDAQRKRESRRRTDGSGHARTHADMAGLVTQVAQAEAEANTNTEAAPDPERAGARVVVVPQSDEETRETVCPLDLVHRAEQAGVLQELAERLGQPVAVIRHEADQFVSYWTIGAGMGRRRSAWMRRLRQRVVNQHGANQLAPPGALSVAGRAIGDAPRPLPPDVLALIGGSRT
jgi:hypothetical protein